MNNLLNEELIFNRHYKLYCVFQYAKKLVPINIFILLVVLITMLNVSSAYADDPFPPLFKASYKLFKKDVEVGVLNRSLTKGNDGAYIYRSTSESTGLISLFYKLKIVEESQWRLVDSKLQPINYRYKKIKNKKSRNIETNFDWKNMKAHNIENDIETVIDIKPSMLDKLSYQVMIMYELMQENYPVRYTIVDSNKIKLYNFEYLGTEEITTPIGKLETLKFLIQKPGDRRKTIIWCASELYYLPIKVDSIEKDDTVTTALINSFKII